MRCANFTPPLELAAWSSTARKLSWCLCTDVPVFLASQGALWSETVIGTILRETGKWIGLDLDALVLNLYEVI